MFPGSFRCSDLFPLPPGWTEHLDDKTGKKYYFYAPSKCSTFNHPGTTTASATDNNIAVVLMEENRTLRDRVERIERECLERAFRPDLNRSDPEPEVGRTGNIGSTATRMNIRGTSSSPPKKFVPRDGSTHRQRCNILGPGPTPRPKLMTQFS
jgi:hypothetical protein